MRKTILSIAMLLGITQFNSYAQTIYDGELFSNTELTGTARFVGMGGALGALGADISTMSTNPAGIGMYRSNDVNFTLGYQHNEVKSDYIGNTMKASKNRFGMNTAGLVISNRFGGSSPVKFVNVGFNYRRLTDFNRNKKMEGLLNMAPDGVVSITHFMDKQANGILDNGVDIAHEINEGYSIYDNYRIGWLAGLGYEGRLIERDDKGYFSYLPQPFAKFFSEERGGIDSYDFNVSMNVSDRFFFGLTIGAYDLDYRKLTYYDEDYDYGEYGLIETRSETSGSGFDFKFGAIIRPFERSPFRIGLAVHTPVFYKLTHYTGAYMESDIYADRDEVGMEGAEIIESDRYTAEDLDGRDFAFDYKLRTPWKYNISLGHNIGSYLALGLEYEYQDFPSMKFSYDGQGGGGINFINSTRSMLKDVHTFKLGAEYRIVPEFAFRLGYNIQTASFKDAAYKDIPLNSTITDVQFTNHNKARNTFTMGLGYTGKVFYTDLAFKFDFYKSQFKPFDDLELEWTELKTNKSQILLTMGIRL